MRQVLYVLSSFVITTGLGQAKINIDINKMYNPKPMETLKEKKTMFYLYFLELPNLYIAKYPKYSTLEGINEITLNPAFTTTVIFKDYKIKKVISSVKLTSLQYYKNTLNIQPSPNTLSGNLDIYLTNDKGKEKFVKILLSNTGLLKPKEKMILYLEYVFLDRKILKPYEVLQKYFTVFKDFPQNETTFYYKGVLYFIKPLSDTDNLLGNAKIGEKRYFISVIRIRD